MAGRPLNIGLIGAGRWGQIYIRTLRRLEGFRLARLASGNPDAAALAGPSCIVSRDWRAVAAADDLDAVIIATPPALHAEMARAAIDAGNPVLVEKPLTLDLHQATDLLAFAEGHDAIVLVDHIHLYHPAYRALKDQALALGPLHAIRGGNGDRGPFRGDTPLLWDRGSHDIAMALDLTGELPVSASCRLREERETAEGPGQALTLKLTFPGGVTAEFQISNLLDKKTRFLAAQYDRDTLIYDDTAPHPLVREPREETARCEPHAAEVIAVRDILPLDQVLADFAAAIGKGTPDLDGLRLGVDVVRVLSEIDATH